MGCNKAECISPGMRLRESACIVSKREADMFVVGIEKKKSLEVLPLQAASRK